MLKSMTLPLTPRQNETVDLTQPSICKIEFYSNFITYELRYNTSRPDELLGYDVKMYIDNLFYIFKDAIKNPSLFFVNITESYAVSFNDSIPSVYFTNRKEAELFLEQIVSFKTANDT